ncbi:KpsF/GutQ family sugar-phosphate isomerase [Georhizobium profundi]|jgi:arabinose-5-phosphate isomerase|uniref:KpsF/GutQ family sugar-phosphate isomerase n=1 Tax=Georhizobium profundi TaxID=2341112 RepID=A0A3S9B885_9HYPH|nr:KpsF/GutQ family sugar-phosphate isomerase [Georhizobium profundi]AZN73198.1 KpsF/GutQ family sugar-phosphate isomerase [Georhizobium profundi]GLQ38054.1 capsule expression protein [Rhizobium albus]
MSMTNTQDAPSEITASALRTLEIERAGLAALQAALANGLGDRFREAVESVRAATGRVIVTGVGKSGHIGSKLAATLASTGTPAFFVHPVEANHGDLGMIAQDDLIIAMSWSGETAELRGIIAYAKRFRIPLIGLTSGAESTLAQEADVALIMPKEQEACPHGLAPTTSTIMQLALGDALAIALLETRGFTANDFRVFHPGGKLGSMLTHVSDLMHSGDRLPLVPIGTGVPEAVAKLSEKRFGCVGIVGEGGGLVGIITDGDLARNLARDLSGLLVEEMMTVNPKTVAGSVLAGSALALLEDHNISALFVTDENRRPVGIVHFHDLLRVGAA